MNRGKKTGGKTRVFENRWVNLRAFLLFHSALSNIECRKALFYPLIKLFKHVLGKYFSKIFIIHRENVLRFFLFFPYYYYYSSDDRNYYGRRRGKGFGRDYLVDGRGSRTRFTCERKRYKKKDEEEKKGERIREIEENAKFY